MKNFFMRGLVLIGTLLLGVAIGLYFQTGKEDQDEEAIAGQDAKPLYWIAPMDPNFRRDKPGKSPMGMDLIPVYEEKVAGNEDDNVIRIAPYVVNNLGVRSAAVEKQRLENNINTVGYVQYAEDRLVHIHPRVSGWIDKLYTKATGDPVTKGEPLYALYSPELVNAQEEMLLALRGGDKRLINATEDRMRALQIPQSFIEQIKKTRTVRQKVTFYAPQSGVVDNLNVREGFFVQPGINIMSIGSLKQVWVEAEIFAAQAAQINVGDRAQMSSDYAPERNWGGRVDYIYPALNADTRTLRLRLRFDNPDSLLRPNMFVKLAIATQSSDTFVTVPSEALIRTGHETRVVLDLGDGQFKSIPVEIGRVGAQRSEVVSGLSEGDKVVISAQFLLDSESNKSAELARMEADENKMQMENKHKEMEVGENKMPMEHKHNDTDAGEDRMLMENEHNEGHGLHNHHEHRDHD